VPCGSLPCQRHQLSARNAVERGYLAAGPNLQRKEQNMRTVLADRVPVGPLISPLHGRTRASVDAIARRLTSAAQGASIRPDLGQVRYDAERGIGGARLDCCAHMHGYE